MSSTTDAGTRTGGAYERITVNLTERASDALRQAAEISKDLRTDVVNKALLAYALMISTQQNGGVIYMRESDGAELERVRFL